jgi:thiaminase/transcriptional activator TenA
VAEWNVVVSEREPSSGETPTGRLRAAVAGDWDSAVSHPFVAGLFADTLPGSAMRVYLVQDYQFVDAFVALMGAAVAAADTTGARMVIARQLGRVAGEENTYFQRSLDALGVADDEREHPALLPPTASFIALMTEAAGTRDYAACLAVLTVAEWLYLDWASRAPDPPPANPIAREWIELHDNPPFAAWVAFLRAELDRLIPALTPAARDRCARFFAEAARLERAFFEAAYTALAPPRATLSPAEAEAAER